MDILIYFVIISPPMKITTKEVRSVTGMLDDIIEEYKVDQPKSKRDWRTYEQQLTQRIRTAIRNLEPLIDEAISSLQIVKGETRGRKPILTVKQKVQLLLLKHLFERSNREMSNVLVAFSMLSGIDVSYKTIERLYSDEEVMLVLMNLHALILKKKGVNDPDCCGDGTGYSVTIKKHYASDSKTLKNKKNEPAKKSEKPEDTKEGKIKSKKSAPYIFSFRLMDLDTRLYTGYGTSQKSEQEAFFKAMNMAVEVGAGSIRLDRYYSCQEYVRLMEKMFGKDVKIYLIPKKNATIKGSLKWKKIMHDFVNDTSGFLGEFFRRNQSESGFSEDKRRFGWMIAQRRYDRINSSNFCTTLWHNMFWMGRD